MNYLTRFLKTALILSLLSFADFAYSKTFYVSPAGDDENRGTLSEPFLTLQRAADVVMNGDIVLVREGTYAGFTLSNRLPDVEEMVTFKPFNNEKVIIDSRINGGIKIFQEKYVIVESIEIVD